MSISRLRTLASPPIDPEDNTGDWEAVETKLGLSLPIDYKQLIASYGSGQFMDFVMVSNPFARNLNLHLLKHARGQLKADRLARQDLLDLYEEDYPFPLYPEADGLLPWGLTFNGDCLYWQTKGRPGKWPIVVWQCRNNAHSLYELTLTEFLYQWMTGNLRCRIFPKKDRHAIPAFTPFRPSVRVTIQVSEGHGSFNDRLAQLRDYFESSRIKQRFQGQDFKQCIFLAGIPDVEILFEDYKDFGTRIQIDYPRKVEKEIKALVRRIPHELGWDIIQIYKTVGHRSIRKDTWKNLVNAPSESD